MKAEVYFRHRRTRWIYRVKERHRDSKGVIAIPVLFPKTEVHIPTGEVGEQVWPQEDGTFTNEMPEGYIEY